MDLEKLNSVYKKSKKKLEDKKKKIEVFEKDIKAALEDIELANAEKILAQRNNDVDAVKDAEDKIKKIKEDIKKIKESIEEEKEEMQMFQDKVDKIIEEIKENPEMKQHLEQVLAKRYDREIRDIKKKKKEEEKKLESLEAVQKMVNEHPTMKNHLQGMLNANASIRKLNKELLKMNAVKDKDRIDDIKDEIMTQTQKLEKNRDGILDFANKKKINITKETLEDIMKNSVINAKTNKVDIEGTLNKNIRSSKRQIKGYEKQISNNEKAIIKVGYRVPTKRSIGDVENDNENDNDNENENDNDNDNENENDNDNENENDKLKWWQFIKRFNRWKENKRIQSLPDPEDKDPKAKKGEFATSLKYEVVQDIAEQMKQEKLKEVKREVKGTER